VTSSLAAVPKEEKEKETSDKGEEHRVNGRDCGAADNDDYVTTDENVNQRRWVNAHSHQDLAKSSKDHL
jgi:hypothetical protein